MMSVPTGNPGRDGQTVHSVQLLRAIAATMVALFHAQKAFALGVHPPLFSRESYLFGFGAVGVHIFFVISGFVMVATHDPGRYRASNFFKRRLARIYPTYWIFVVLYIAIPAALGLPYYSPDLKLIGTLALWPGYSSGVIGPAWTLTYELFFYICFALAMTLGMTRGLVVLAAVFFGAIAAGAVIPEKSELVLLVTNTLLLEFLAGAAIGWTAKVGKLPLQSGRALTALGVLLFLAGIAVGYERLPSAIAWGMPSALLILGLVTWEAKDGAPSAVRWIGKAGDCSYALYLAHVLIIALALAAARRVPGSSFAAPPIAAAVLGLASFVFALAFHAWIERPLLARLNPSRNAFPRRTREALTANAARAPTRAA